MNHLWSLIFGLFLCRQIEAKLIKVYKSTLTQFNENEPSGLHYKANALQKVSNDSFTICLRFNYQRLSETSRVLGFANEDKTQFLWLSADFPRGGTWLGMGTTAYGFGHFSQWVLKDLSTGDFILWNANTWHHFCFAYSKPDSRVLIVKDGHVLRNEIDDRIASVRLPPNFLDKIYIGRNQDGVVGWSRHKGSITDVHLWNKALAANQLIKWTLCDYLDQGDLINWNQAQWNIVNMEWYIADMSSICRTSQIGWKLFPNPANFSFASSACQSLKGHLILPGSLNDEKALGELVQQRGEICLNETWIDLSDEETEGIFVSKSKSIEKYQYNWMMGEPNGDTLENCVVYSAGKTDVSVGIRTGLNDYPCDYSRCFTCDISQTLLTFKMRGLCYGTSFDTHYSWNSLSQTSDHYSFTGFSGSLLEWNSSSKAWILSDDQYPNTYAICNDTTLYPLGVHYWYFFNESCYMSESSDVYYRLPISFSTCLDDEYTCHNGNCIDLSQVCDGRLDCQDKSDEMQCEMVRYVPSYLQSYPPPPALKTDELTQIDMEVIIESILDIDESKSLMQMQFELRLKWIDPRLEFVHLKKSVKENILSKSDKDKLWIPSLTFINTKDKTRVTFNDHQSLGIVKLKNESKATKSPFHILTNMVIYSGADCQIQVSKHFLADFICLFDLHFYPFDYQKCQARIAIKNSDQDFVQLIVTNLMQNGPSDLKQYVVDKTVYIYDGNEVIIEIYFAREIINVLLTLVLPTILISLVTFTTNLYSRKRHFEAIVAVNLTSFLVSVTLYTSIFLMLPSTSYLKLMDVWLIFVLFIPFVEVTIHAIIEHLQAKNKKGRNLVEVQVIYKLQTTGWTGSTGTPKKSSFEKLLHFGVPMIFILFCLSFFEAGFILLWKNSPN